MNRYRQYEPDHMEIMTRAQEEDAIAEERRQEELAYVPGEDEVRDRLMEAMVDDERAEEAYAEYLAGLDERLADRFPEAF